MTPSWSEPGYPIEHERQKRSAWIFAMRAIAFTGLPCLLLLTGTMIDGVPPILSAVAITVFLMFGIIGGLTGIHDTHRFVRIIPYFERRIGEIETFTAGAAIARFSMQLDALAEDLQVPKLTSFGFADDLSGEVVQWHPPETCLQTIDALLAHLAEAVLPVSIRDPIVADLKKWQHALRRAAAQGVHFCLLLRHGNVTSGHEWDIRIGSAF